MKTDTISAIQHARALHAVTFATVCVMPEVFQYAEKDKLGKLVEKIRRWADEVKHTGGMARRLSAGAHRTLDPVFKKLDALVASLGTTKDPDEVFLRWASMVYAADLCIRDARTLCREYTRDSAWRWLAQHYHTMSDSLEFMEPEVAVRGTAIYEDVAPRDCFY